MNKRYLFLLVPLAVLAVVVGLVLLPGQQKSAKAEGQVITWLKPSTPVEKSLEADLLPILAKKSPTTGVFTYAITNIAKYDKYSVVSVAGFPMGTSAPWTLDNAIWLGNITLTVTDGQPAGIIDTIDSNAVGPTTGVGGAGTILPFRSGTTATYGIAGVHDCGFSLTGWKAVDLFPTENQVYSAESGEVNYVCRDNFQVGVRIGNMLYDHLVDKGQQVGDKYTQGQAMGSLKTGSFNQPCGYASQGASEAHVHWCFVPNSGGTFAADGYALSIANNNWVKAGNTVAPGGILTASWQNANVAPPGPTAGANFWDGIADGGMTLVNSAVKGLPTHTDMSIVTRVITTLNPVLKLTYDLILSNFDMTVTLWVIGIIFALEAARLIYAAWMWVKRAVPFL